MTVEEPETDEADFLSAFHPAAPHYYRPAPVEPVTADDEDDEEFNSCANCRIAARYVM
jgi:hypothetical protein